MEIDLKLDIEAEATTAMVESARTLIKNANVSLAARHGRRCDNVAPCLSKKHRLQLQENIQIISKEYDRKYEEQLNQLRQTYGGHFEAKKNILFQILQIQQNPQQMQQLKAYLEQLVGEQ